MSPASPHDSPPSDESESQASDRDPQRSLGGDATIAGDESAAGPELLLETESRVDRYLVDRPIGAGGMGVVYAAHDPELDRPVALKVLRRNGGSTNGVRRERRLIREARAMAKLSHANVITVYDVGTVGDQVFIAMELIEGQTVKQWLVAQPPWQRVLEVFIRAGSGLAAAHRVGLVHRDFKPSNVLIAHDGRVLVVDFGLARHPAPTEAAGRPGIVTSVRTSVHKGPVGTPGYIAPEQLWGKKADPRADQFAFCVALYEALYGERPFVGETSHESMAQAVMGNVRSARRGTSIPGWARRVVIRGLRPDPAERWDSMDDLLVALANDAGKRRARRLLLVTGLAGAGLAAWAGFSSYTRHVARCQGAEQKLVGVWDDDTRAGLHDALVSTGASFAEGTWGRLEPKLDAYAREWIAMRTEACESTRDGEQSAALLDLRMACLDERRSKLRALVEVLSQSDASVAVSAISAVAGLDSLAACADLHTLLAGGRAVAPEIDVELQDQLAKVLARLHAGQHSASLEMARALEAAARGRGSVGLVPRVLHVKGLAQQRVGHREAAESTLEQAYFLARANGDDDQAVRIGIALVQLLGAEAGRVHEAQQWAEHVRSDPIMREAPVLQANLANALGNIAHVLGDYDSAVTRFRTAMSLGDQPGLGEPVADRTVFTNLAASLVALGAYEEAAVELSRGSGAIEERFGPNHPVLASMLTAQGDLAFHLGKLDRARASFERALHISEGAYSAGHPSVARALSNYANTLHKLGDDSAAVESFERAIAILERLSGPTADLAATLTNLGIVEARLDHVRRARALHLRAVTMFERTLGSGHKYVGTAELNLSGACLEAGDLQCAQRHSTTALAVLERALGDTHPEIGAATAVLGETLVQRGQTQEGIAALRRAVSLMERADYDPGELAKTRFGLARALDRIDRDEARTLAIRARTDAEPWLRPEVEQWLSRR